MKTPESSKAPETRIVNRVPPSSTKRRGGGSSREPAKRHKADVVDKLDPKDPVHAKRIQQRRKAIAKGKNTAGYDAYIQKVPKEARRVRSMDTPSTPDPLMDVPKKRWDGQIRAWRIALHKYDPPDFVSSAQLDTTASVPATPTPTKKNLDMNESSMESSPRQSSLASSPISVWSQDKLNESKDDSMSVNDSDDDLL